MRQKVGRALDARPRLLDVLVYLTIFLGALTAMTLAVMAVLLGEQEVQVWHWDIVFGVVTVVAGCAACYGLLHVAVLARDSWAMRLSRRADKARPPLGDFLLSTAALAFGTGVYAQRCALAGHVALVYTLRAPHQNWVACAVPGCESRADDLYLARERRASTFPPAGDAGRVLVVPLCDHHKRHAHVVVEHRLFERRDGDEFERAKLLYWP